MKGIMKGLQFLIDYCHCFDVEVPFFITVFVMFAELVINDLMYKYLE